LTLFSAVRKLVNADSLPPFLHKCTFAVKRADPESASHLKEQDIINSHTFAKFMRLLRNEGSVVILGTDKLKRFGILCPMEVNQGTDSSYSADEFAAVCYVGDVEEVKQFLTRPSAEEATGSAAVDTSNGNLWEPPGSNQDGDGAGLWQPPGADSSDGMDFGGASESTGFEAWHPSNEGEQISGQKRKLSDSDQEFHTDSGAAAADAFYSGLTRSLDTRADSWLFHMRAFNGWVKATQIQELDPKTNVKGKKTRTPLRVLDLACGKGGDLGKWVLHDRGVSNYVGVDVARGSLLDAALRARKMKKLKKCTFTCADLGADVPGRLRSSQHKRMQELLSWSRQDESEFETGDPKFKMVRGGGISLNDKFDVVSIQFAIHYMMQTRTRARRFFQTVSELLEIGGNLIATTIDARVVIDHMLDLGLDLHFKDDKQVEGALVEVGGGACRIQFDGDVVRKIFTSRNVDASSEDLFGLQYTFTLVEGSDHAAGVGDAVNLPEWLTPIPVLKSLAAEAGLELESAENFHEFYTNRSDPSSCPLAHSALHNMKVLDRNGSISAEEWEVSRLYTALKFRKVRESSMTLDEATENDDSGTSDNEANENGRKEETGLSAEMKAKWMPMALMKAKRSTGNDEWKALSSEEKTCLIEVELQKMATSNS
jgi:mRNA (guanine-N7-)-methyltransferase